MYLFPDAPESIRRCPWSRLDGSHNEPLARAGFTESDIPSFLITYIKVWLFLPHFRYWWHIQLLLYAAQLLAVAGRENAVVTYSDEMTWQYMKRQQIKECIDVHGHDSMLAALLVYLVVIRDMSVSNIEYPGISNGHAVGIAPDVLEHLSDSLGRWLGMYDPVLVEALLAYSLGDGNLLLLHSAGQQAHETSPELTAHGGHRKEERCTSAAMNLMPNASCINASARYNAVDMWMVKKIRSPRVEDGSHASLKPHLGSKCINSAPCSLEHTVVELPLVSHRYRMQTVRQRENDMEVPDRDDFLPAELNPLLTLLLLALGTMTVSAAVVADMYVPTFGTYLYMPAQGTGTALRHVLEGSFNRRNDMMPAKELSTVAPDNLTDVEARPHLVLGGNMVSIRRTCLIGSMLAT